MSYALAGALQKAVYQTLQSDAALTGVLGAAVHDAAPPGPLPDLLVTLGAERVETKRDSGGFVARHRFTVSVLSEDMGGFAQAKAAAAAVTEALDGTAPVLERGRVVALDFERADARRMPRGKRHRIDLRFVARLEDS